ncbi:MAG: type II secretion system protein GspM [Pseudomonadota bacterium]
MLQRFHALGQREKALVLALGVVVAVLLLSLLIVQPLLSFEKRAKADYSRSLQIAAIAEKLKPASANAPVDDRSLRSAVTESAAQRSLVIVRINATEDGELELALNGVPFRTFYAWLETLRVEHSIVVQEAFVTTGDTDGSLDVRLTLMREA